MTILYPLRGNLRLTVSFDKVARHLPPAVFVFHRRNRFNSFFLVRKRSVELNDHVFAVRRARNRLCVLRAPELPRNDAAERFPNPLALQCPFVFRNSSLKKRSRLFPALNIFPGINQRQPLLRCFPCIVFRFSCRKHETGCDSNDSDDLDCSFRTQKYVRVDPLLIGIEHFRIYRPRRSRGWRRAGWAVADDFSLFHYEEDPLRCRNV